MSAMEALRVLRRGEVHAARALLEACPDGSIARSARTRLALVGGHAGAAEPLARSALADADGPLETGHALLACALCALRAGRLIETDALLHRLDLLAGVDPQVDLDALFTRIEWLGQAGRQEDGLPRLLAAAESVRRSASPEDVAMFSMNVAFELRRLQRWDEAVPWLDASAALIQAGAWPALRARWLATRASYPGPEEPVTDQESRLREALELLESTGDVLRAVAIMNNLGTRLIALGRDAEAAELYARALPRAGHHRVFIGCALYEVLHRIGRGHEGDAVLDALVAEGATTPAARAHLHTALLGLAARRGDWRAWREAYAVAGPALRSSSNQSLVSRAAAELEARDGHLEEAAVLAAVAWAARGAVSRDLHAERARIERLAARGAPVPLGEHVLLERIGAGGMGSVWKARHLPTGEARAVKIVPPAPDEAAARAVHREVEALAMLEHPHVVRILDRGVAEEPVEWGSSGAILAGSTWLAMPLARRSLDGLCGRLGWDAVRSVLLAALDGLAHAHAHGLLHLDVKPENLLVDRDAPPFTAVLADFGLARPERDGAHRLVGTPWYMAPEQFRRQWREWGPWTDLYALGGTAVTLVQGRPPYDLEDVRALANAHLSGNRPPLEPAVDVPEGLEAWVDRMMALSPADRFSGAADAAAALSALGPPVPRASPASPSVVGTTTFEWVDESVEPDADAGSHGPVRAGVSLAMPADWRTDLHASHASTADLFAYRQIAVEGRDAERDALWNALRDVDAGGGPRVLLVRGPRGSGTERLLRWLMVRVGALGVGRVARSTHSTQHALADLLRTEGLDGEALTAHLFATARRPVALPVDVAERALTTDDPQACADAMAALSRDRPLLLVHPSASRPFAVLDAVERVLAGDGRVLVVMAIRDDEFLERPDLAARLTGLARHPRWSEVRLAPLPRGALKRIVRGTVALEPELLERLADRAEGSPGYAMALLRGWSRGGHLHPGPTGHRVPESVEARPPAGLERSERVVAALDPVAREALTLLAVLGPSPEGRWAAMADAAGTPLDAETVFALRDAGLLLVHEWRVRVVSPALRDALIAGIAEPARLRTVHGLAARALADADTPEDLASLGLRHVASGHPEAAVEPLRAACRGMVDAGRRASLLAHLERALHAAGVRPDDPRWLELWALDLDRRHEQWDRAAVAERLPRYASLAAGVPEHAWRARLYAALLGPDPSGALQAVWDGLPAGLEDARERVCTEAAWVALQAGDLPRAEAWLDRSGSAGPLVLELRSSVCARRGELAEAHRLARAACDAIDPGASLAPAVWSHLGDLCRDLGRFDDARVAYERSRELAELRDDPLRAVADLNLVALALRRDEPVSAARIAAVVRAARGGPPEVDAAARILGLLVTPPDQLPLAAAALAAVPQTPELAALVGLVHERRPAPDIAALLGASAG